MAKNTMGTKLPRKLKEIMSLLGEQIKIPLKSISSQKNVHHRLSLKSGTP